MMSYTTPGGPDDDPSESDDLLPNPNGVGYEEDIWS